MVVVDIMTACRSASPDSDLVAAKEYTEIAQSHLKPGIHSVANVDLPCGRVRLNWLN